VGKIVVQPRPQPAAVKSCWLPRPSTYRDECETRVHFVDLVLANARFSLVVTLLVLGQIACRSQWPWPPHQVGFISLRETNPWVKELVAGTDNNIFFVTTAPNSLDNVIGRMTPDGTVTVFPQAASLHLRINGLASGPDGAIWFTGVQRSPGPVHAIYRMSPSGSLTQYVISAPHAFPQGIAVGSGGSVWFAETSADRIGHLTSDGKLREYAIPQAPGTHAGPWSIALGRDGTVWFTLTSGNAIGRLTPRGEMTEFAVPMAGSRPLGIVAGPDGNIWFTESAANKIARITPSGEITEFSSPAIKDSPHSIATGLRNDLWFCEIGWMGRITVDGRASVRGDPGGGTCASIIEDKSGYVWSTQNLGPGPWRFAGPAHGVVAKFLARDWPD
jgi:streptogramin lyase